MQVTSSVTHATALHLRERAVRRRAIAPALELASRRRFDPDAGVQREAGGLRDALSVVLGRLRRYGLQREHLLPAARTHRDTRTGRRQYAEDSRMQSEL